MESSFKADVADFPFDNQEFVFHFGSWSLGEDKLTILKDQKSMLDSHYLEDAEWKLLRSHKETLRAKYDSDTYSEIMFKYTVSRKPAYSFITAIAPSLGLMVLTLSSFILPPYNGERIKIILTSLLALTVFLVQMNGYLPRNSETIPFIQVFYMVTMGECILCFITTCIFVRLFAIEKKEKIAFLLPKWMKKHLLRIKAKDFMMISESCNKKKTLLKFSEEDESNSNSVNHVSRINKLKNRAKEVSWIQLLENADKFCMRVFVFMFLVTTTTILFPPYYRKYHR